MKKVLLLAGIAGMVAANAEAFDATPYVGLDMSYAMVDRDHADTQISSKDWSLAGVLGARTDRFGVEAYYKPGLEEHKSGGSTRLTSYGVDALVFQDLGCSGRWELVGAAGLAQYRLKVHDGSDAFWDHGYGERLGAGVQYAVSDKLTVRAMYHHAWVQRSYVDALDEFTVGVRYAF